MSPGVSLRSCAGPGRPRRAVAWRRGDRYKPRVARVSIVIPTYQRRELLLETLASVAAQTYRDFECIVADDGSRDGTGDAVAAFAAGDARFRYVRQDNRGTPGATRNLGLRHATGELVAFLDDDDLWTPEKLVEQVAILDAEPDVALVFTQVQRFGAGDGIWPEATLPRRFDLNTLVRRNVIPCSSVLVRRAALDRAGPFDEVLRFGEDFELWLRIARHAPLRFHPEVRVRYRVQATGLSKNLTAELDALGIIFDRARRLLGVPRLVLMRPLRNLHAKRARAARTLRERIGHWLRWCFP